MAEFFAILGLVAIAGALGGILNAFISDKGLQRPQTINTDQGRVWQPGWIGNVGIGAIGAGVSYMLYGPAAQATVIGGADTPSPFVLSVAALGTAILTGLAGSRWLTAEVEKQLFKATADQLASKPAVSTERKQEILAMPAAEAYMAAESE
jgi:hypothetical protein